MSPLTMWLYHILAVPPKLFRSDASWTMGPKTTGGMMVTRSHPRPSPASRSSTSFHAARSARVLLAQYMSIPDAFPLSTAFREVSFQLLSSSTIGVPAWPGGRAFWSAPTDDNNTTRRTVAWCFDALFRTFRVPSTAGVMTAVGLSESRTTGEAACTIASTPAAASSNAPSYASRHVSM